jgi:hypothetical protein
MTSLPVGPNLHKPLNLFAVLSQASHAAGPTCGWPTRTFDTIQVRNHILNFLLRLREGRFEIQGPSGSEVSPFSIERFISDPPLKHPA